MFFNCLAWNHFSNLDYSIDILLTFLRRTERFVKTKIMYYVCIGDKSHISGWIKNVGIIEKVIPFILELMWMTKWRIDKFSSLSKQSVCVHRMIRQIYYWLFSQKAMSITQQTLKTLKLNLLTWRNTILDGPQVIGASEDRTWGVCYDGETARLRNLA